MALVNTPAAHPDLPGFVADLTRARLEAQPLPWPATMPADVPLAYATALAVRNARSAQGDRPVGQEPVYGLNGAAQTPSRDGMQGALRCP
jgi:hypothetical protein